MEQSSNAQRVIRVQAPLVSLIDPYLIFKFVLFYFLHLLSLNLWTFRGTQVEIVVVFVHFFQGNIENLNLVGICVWGLVLLTTCIFLLGVLTLWLFGDTQMEILVKCAVFWGNLWNFDYPNVFENCLAFEFCV